MLKFGLKLGIVGGTCYVLSEEGVWRESTETAKLYDKISNNISPYVKDVAQQVPFEIPALPSSDRISFVAKQYWNCGVMSTFKFIGDLPTHIGGWSKKGLEAIRENESVRNMLTPSASENVQENDNKKS